MGKTFEKQTKTIEDQGKKQVDALKVLKPITQELTIKNIIPENILIYQAKYELDKIKEIEKTVDRENLVYKSNNHTNKFKDFRTIKTFGRGIYNGTITLKKLIMIRVICWWKF